MAEDKYEKGKVYLQDTRTGKIYLHERNLEKNKNFTPCVPNPIETKKPEGKTPEDDK